ncbi:MAG TPA: septum formation initiator family protein [Actinomycetota bacterium]|jgi:cell division protein FtsB
MSTRAAGPKVRMPKLGLGPQIVVFFLILGLLGAMAIQPTRQLMAQRSRIKQATLDLAHVLKSNERLQTRINRLQDPDYVDQLARSQAGLVKPGEIPFVVMPPGRDASAHKAKAERAAEKPPPPPPPSFVESLLRFVGVS